VILKINYSGPLRKGRLQVEVRDSCTSVMECPWTVVADGSGDQQGVMDGQGDIRASGEKSMEGRRKRRRIRVCQLHSRGNPRIREYSKGCGNEGVCGSCTRTSNSELEPQSDGETERGTGDR
jgi:hypothetical protein